MVEVAGVEPASEISIQPGGITTISPIYSPSASQSACLGTSVTSQDWAHLDLARHSHSGSTLPHGSCCQAWIWAPFRYSLRCSENRRIMLVVGNCDFSPLRRYHAELPPQPFSTPSKPFHPLLQPRYLPHTLIAAENLQHNSQPLRKSP